MKPKRQPVEGRILTWLWGPEVREESGTLMVGGQLAAGDVPVKNDELITFKGRTWRVLETGMKLTDGRAVVWVRLGDPATTLPSM